MYGASTRRATPCWSASRHPPPACLPRTATAQGGAWGQQHCSVSTLSLCLSWMQVSGEWQVRDSKLKELCADVERVLKGFNETKFEHVERCASDCLTVETSMETRLGPREG